MNQYRADSSLKHKNTQPLYIFNRENPQKSEPQNGPRRGLDFIALRLSDPWLDDKNRSENYCMHTETNNVPHSTVPLRL